MKARSHGLTWRSQPLTIILHLLTPVGPFGDYDFRAVDELLTFPQWPVPVQLQWIKVHVPMDWIGLSSPLAMPLHDL